MEAEPDVMPSPPWVPRTSLSRWGLLVRLARSHVRTPLTLPPDPVHPRRYSPHPGAQISPSVPGGVYKTLICKHPCNSISAYMTSCYSDSWLFPPDLVNRHKFCHTFTGYSGASPSRAARVRGCPARMAPGAPDKPLVPDWPRPKTDTVVAGPACPQRASGSVVNRKGS